MKTKQQGISRQARKTIEKILTTESVSIHSVLSLLDALGFKKTQTGSHRIWRHHKGYRIQFTHVPGQNEIWGYQLKDMRNLLKEIEEKEEIKFMAYVNSRIGEKPTPSEVANYKDSQMLTEKSLPNLSKLDLSGVETAIALKRIADSNNKLAEFLQQLGSMAQSTQEFLLEVASKIDKIQTVTQSPALKLVDAKPAKQKMNKEELLAFRREHALKVSEKQRAEKISKIKEAQKNHPNLASNPIVMAGLTGIHPQTVEKYMKQGLV